jgi:hypothetical protein
MAIFLSDILLPSTNKTAVFNPLQAGRMFEQSMVLQGRVTLAGAVAVGDIIGLAGVTQNAFIRSIKIANQDLGTTGAASLGLYRPEKGLQNADTVLTQSGITNGVTLFATGINLSVANGFTDYRYSNPASADPTTNILMAYELAAQTTNPNVIPSGPNVNTDAYVIALTVSTATTVGGIISFTIEWGV